MPLINPQPNLRDEIESFKVLALHEILGALHKELARRQVVDPAVLKHYHELAHGFLGLRHSGPNQSQIGECEIRVHAQIISFQCLLNAVLALTLGLWVVAML